MIDIPVSLPSIVAVARAGSLDLAWQLFRAGGYDDSAEPAALTLKGRLLKDQAHGAAGADRTRLYRAAADAYAAAAERAPSSYPLVNAATLALLSGDQPRSRELASRILDLIAANPEEPETPYYRAATRAEALLLLGETELARDGLAEAVNLAPEAWEDHASTLRQFGVILQALGSDIGWLEALRPPGSIHFGGHMSFEGGNGTRAELRTAILKVLEEERVGFGFGALAAGADIIIAETLVEHGAELHVVLPGGAIAFAAESVDPYGSDWRRRFDQLLERATTVRPVRPIAVPPEAQSVVLADHVAMGLARLNASRLQSSAIQLLVTDPAEGPAASGESATRQASSQWTSNGWRQHAISAPREVGAPSSSSPKPDTARQIHHLAVLTIAFDGGDAAGPDTEARLEAIKARLARSASPVVPAQWNDGYVAVGYAAVSEAAEIALDLASMKLRVGGDYLAGQILKDPFSGNLRFSADALAMAAPAGSSALPGTACVTEDFAAAFVAAGSGHASPELAGELEARAGMSPMPLYVLKRSAPPGGLAPQS